MKNIAVLIMASLILTMFSAGCSDNTPSPGRESGNKKLITCSAIGPVAFIAGEIGGDKIMSLPVICMVGAEAWRTKEAKGSLQENPAWGDENTRGIYWEIGTASSLLQAGSDILVMRHPAAVKAIKKTISELMVK